MKKGELTMSELINELIELNKVAKEDEEEIVAYSLDKIKKLALDNTSKEILTKYGIPKFLSLDMTFFTESKGGFEKFGDFIKRQLMEGEVLPELEIFEENPEGDFWEEVIDENWIEEFENYIRELDYQAVDNDTFWDEVLAITINMA
ncbi:MAG: hypothetical protein IJA34_16080 [Lachnospiraceae bacterium]|nr:hypothetical protein [Lachnospiraceae bacterium]